MVRVIFTQPSIRVNLRRFLRCSLSRIKPPSFHSWISLELCAASELISYARSESHSLRTALANREGKRIIIPPDVLSVGIAGPGAWKGVVYVHDALLRDRAKLRAACTHAVLHLMGHSHDSCAGFKRMRREEGRMGVEYLKGWNSTARMSGWSVFDVKKRR